MSLRVRRLIKRLRGEYLHRWGDAGETYALPMALDPLISRGHNLRPTLIKLRAITFSCLQRKLWAFGVEQSIWRSVVMPFISRIKWQANYGGAP